MVISVGMERRKKRTEEKEGGDRGDAWTLQQQPLWSSNSSSFPTKSGHVRFRFLFSIENLFLVSFRFIFYLFFLQLSRLPLILLSDDPQGAVAFYEVTVDQEDVRFEIAQLILCRFLKMD